MPVYCKKCTCLILCWRISWCFLFFVVHVVCKEREGSEGYRCQTLSEKIPVLGGHFGKWLIFAILHFLLTSTIRLILSDVDLVLSHIPFTPMFPHLLQTSEISPEADACFCWCWRKCFHRFILPPTWWGCLTSGSFADLTASGYNDGHSAEAEWCDTEWFWWWTCCRVCFLRFIFEVRNRFTISKNDQIWHV